MKEIIRKATIPLFIIGLICSAFTITYGYIFNIWSDAFFALAVKQEGLSGFVHSKVSSIGELCLFTFLSIISILASIASNLIGNSNKH